MSVRRLTTLFRELDVCKACPKMIGPVVHGPAIESEIFLLGQAPGPREGSFGRPFAWTAGRTLFRWLQEATGANEETVRATIYFAAVARCFPGKAPGGGDRKPDRDEIARCRPFIEREVTILRPRLVLPVGALAIEEVLGYRGKLDAIIGTQTKGRYHGVDVDVIALPHPSGASPWHKMEPGKTLLGRALALIGKHPATLTAFG